MAVMLTLRAHLDVTLLKIFEMSESVVSHLPLGGQCPSPV